MMKNILVLLFITVLSTGQLFPQDELDFSEERKTKKILLVPFDPIIYFNDATEIIARRDNLNHDEILIYFRTELNKQLYNSLMDSCIITNLLVNANTREAEDDIESLYSITRYRLDLAMPNRPEDPESVPKKKYFERKKDQKNYELKKEEMYQARTRIENGEIVGKRQPVEDKYLHIEFHDPEILAEVARRRNIEYFLFINQFEIKGDYGSPYMSGDPNATRTLKVHFSLFDSYGDLVHGGFGENKIPFYLDDKKEIVNKYFPEVIRQIMRNIDF